MSQVCYVQNLITFSKYRVRPECKLKGKAKRKVPGWWEAQGKAARNDLPKDVLQMETIISLSHFSTYSASASKNDSLQN